MTPDQERPDKVRTHKNAPTRLALMCRAGFEDDLFEEVAAWMTAHGGTASLGWKEPGMLLVALDSATGARPPLPAHADLIFARDLMLVRSELSELDTRDRFGPIESAIEKLGPLRSITVLTADSDAGKPLAPLVRGLEGRVAARVGNGKASAHSADLATAKASAHSADPQKKTDAKVWLVSGTHALVGTALPGPGALFPGGIPRLRFPREAPSRSTLKLDEAFCVLLTESERNRWLKAGMRAVDLGAAPGGWTYQLVRRHIRVIAVDNGRMDATLLATGLVEHLREDGFRYTPARPVDWLVCDMVEKPARVVDLVLRWFKGGHCRAAIFNLKLPMKKRYAAWEQARAAFAPLTASGFELRARQLYHDREEITVALLQVGKVKPSQTPMRPVKVQNQPGGRIHRRRP